MTMKKVMTILTVLTVLTFCSCSSAEREFGIASADVALEDAVELSIEDEQLTDEIETVDRKIIKEGRVRFETKDIDKTKSLIHQTVQELNGYFANDNAYNYSDRIEHRLEIRVPANKFDLLLMKISENVDKFDNKNIDVTDVTEEFIDIAARIKTKKELKNRYAELLKQATKVEEILNIEKEMGKLQTEIESVEGRMKYLRDKIAFSTLTVTYYQNTTSEFGFSSKFVDGVKNGWSVFLWFIVGLSHLWVFIIVAVVAVYLIRKWRKKKKKVSQQSQQKNVS
jgi:hypothetical protein